MNSHYNKIIKGTEHEDGLVIAQALKGMVGNTFTLLNYYKELPFTYSARLINIENDMAEFELHELQAKLISRDHKTIIRAHSKMSIREDILGEVFYVNVARKTAILCKFCYVRVNSDDRKYVRVLLDKPIGADIITDDMVVNGVIRNISLGGGYLESDESCHFSPGDEITIILRLSDITTGEIREIAVPGTLIKILNDTSPITYVLEFNPGKTSQQVISYFINQRQVEIIKELKDLIA